MAPIHFRLFENLFASYGYNVEILQTRGRQIVDEGLKYVHNDTCYPALLTIGQMMDALHSGKYDLHKTALIITQTGRRLPCFELHSPFEKGAGKRRPFVYSGHFAQYVRTREKQRLQADAADDPQGAGRACVRRPFDAAAQPDETVSRKYGGREPEACGRLDEKADRYSSQRKRATPQRRWRRSCRQIAVGFCERACDRRKESARW